MRIVWDSTRNLATSKEDSLVLLLRLSLKSNVWALSDALVYEEATVTQQAHGEDAVKEDRKTGAPPKSERGMLWHF